ncbi:pentapeptide repeat-containing protein [Actinoplanes philippinensis]|uniref:pentapeptide repeat-containing protein n=1 Tax=Actinoplanes philippinensis TaxID=35752 RepID=UPI0033CE70EC
MTTALLVVAVGVIVLAGMWLIASDFSGTDRAKLQIEALKYGVGFFAAGGAVAALLLSVRRQRLAEQTHDLARNSQELAERNHQLARNAQFHTESDAAKRRVTDLYAKAVEQLGHSSTAVRLGGLYALERVAQENPEQRQTVVNVLCALLRMSAAGPRAALASHAMVGTSDVEANDGQYAAELDGESRQNLEIRLTAQQILVDHLRAFSGVSLDGMDLGAHLWQDVDLHLRGAVLVDFDFSYCSVRRATFSGATFIGETSFAGTKFADNALFTCADFRECTDFSSAVFSGEVDFREATFADFALFEEAAFETDVNLSRAKFSGRADFGRAEFGRWALFPGVTFTESAVFSRAKFGGDTNFNSADFMQDAWFVGTRFETDSRFHGTKFGAKATFEESIFVQSSQFYDVAFGGQLSFLMSHLFESVRFHNTMFGGRVVFGVTRANSITFSNCRVMLRSGQEDLWPSGWEVSAEGQVGALGKTKNPVNSTT